MKIQICAISDTHNRHNKLNLKSGDLLIHAGDFSGMGYKWEQERFIKWFAKQTYTHKVCIAGNHERGVQEDEFYFKKLCKDNDIHYLNDSSLIVEGVKIWGSPVTPYFFNWAFNRARIPELVPQHGRWIKEHWDLIPEDTNILVTHGMPYGILDETYYVDGTTKENVGCQELLKRIKEIKPDIYIGGHLHGGGGQVRHIDGTSFYNAAVCNDMYVPSNPITYIEYEKERL